MGGFTRSPEQGRTVVGLALILNLDATERWCVKIFRDNRPLFPLYDFSCDVTRQMGGRRRKQEGTFRSFS